MKRELHIQEARPEAKEKLRDEAYLVFSVAKQQFALPVISIRRIIRAVHISPVTDGPDTMLGILNFHGEPVPVVNFRKKFGLPGRKITPDQRIILLETSQLQLALLADQISDMTEPSKLQECPVDLVIHGQEKEIEGLLLVDQHIILIYDLETIFKRDAGLILELYSKTK